MQKPPSWVFDKVLNMLNSWTRILLNLAQSNFSQYYEIFQNIYHVDLHFLNGTESLFFTRYTCLIWIAPSNVLWHQNKHLMENFKFLTCSRIICLPLNISGKFNWQHLFQKLEEAETNPLHLFNTIQYPHTLKNNIYHSNKRGQRLIFHTGTSLTLCHVLVHSVDKTHVLVVTVGLIWLLFLNIQIFSYLTCYRSKPTIVNVTLFFCFMCAVQSGDFFCSCFHSDSAFA